MILKTTISSGQSTSAAVDLVGAGNRFDAGVYALVAVVTGDLDLDQASFNASGWTPADLILEASHNGTTWAPVLSATGQRVRIGGAGLAAATWYAMDPADLASAPFLRLVSVSPGGTTPVAQAATRTLVILTRRISP